MVENILEYLMGRKSEEERIKSIYKEYMNNSNTLNKWSSEIIGNRFIKEEFYKSFKYLIKKNNIDVINKTILDIGCASGNKIKILLKIGFDKENIIGVDIRENCIKNAKLNFPGSKFYKMDARQIKFSDEKFDFINVFTLFSSILDDQNRYKVANEIIRLLKPNGIIMYYDVRYNNPTNKNLKAVKRKQLFKLFPNMKKELLSVTLLPYLSRKLGILNNPFYFLLSKISFLRTHYIGIIKKSEKN